MDELIKKLLDKDRRKEEHKAAVTSEGAAAVAAISGAVGTDES